jgi:1,4-dihydroxy-2-naphthoyl-CoA hydrolase
LEVDLMEVGDDPLGGLDGLIGVEYEEIGPDRCVLTLEIGERHRQPYGLVHGGIYCLLAETAASVGAATYAMEHDMNGAVGVSNSTDFYRSMREGTIRAVATPIHRGRSQQVWQVEMSDPAEDRLLSRAQVRLHNLIDPTVIGGTPG